MLGRPALVILLGALALPALAPSAGAAPDPATDAAALATSAAPGRSIVFETTARSFSDVEPRGEELPLSMAFSFSEPVLAARVSGEGPKDGSSKPHLLDAERAAVLLRSLTIPGWGQATAGHTTSAKVFAVVETGIWASFVAFHVQSEMRRESYERTAGLLAGIDLQGRDEEFRRIVGSFISSDEYNQLVVFRDAANLYYDNPTLYRQYIAEHELRGPNLWNWESEEAFLRYRSQRKKTHQAEGRANTALAMAIVNRLVSALHAARFSGGTPGEGGRSWNLEVTPSDSDDLTAYRLGVRTRF